MASKTNTSRQHKHFAVLIDADNTVTAQRQIFDGVGRGYVDLYKNYISIMKLT